MSKKQSHDSLKQDGTNEASLMHSTEDMAAIIAIESVHETSLSNGENPLQNNTFILVEPTGTITDISKHEQLVFGADEPSQSLSGAAAGALNDAAL